MNKSKQPETLTQAHRFTKYAARYRAAGLCPRCAAQAAYGHQHGWVAVHAPCTVCAVAVAALPHVQPNNWRSLPVTRSIGRGRPTGTSTPGNAGAPASAPHAQQKGGANGQRAA